LIELALEIRRKKLLQVRPSILNAERWRDSILRNVGGASPPPTSTTS